MLLGRNSTAKNNLNRDERKLSQGYVDLKKQTAEELIELISRQDKLLRNRLFIEKLPDKGKKIISFRDELQHELKTRQSAYDSACELLSGLTLNNSRAEDLEWNKGESKVSKRQELDSDDDEDESYSDCESDPLKLIASHSGTCNGVKKKIGFQTDNSVKNKIDYVNKMCKKYDSDVQTKERFKPNQVKESKRDLVETSAERLKNILGDKWEITEATPPVFMIKNTKAITLAESLQLQKEQAEKLREMEKRSAIEKLQLNMNIKMGEKLPQENVDKYRISSNHFDESANDETDEESDSDN